jgi:hypothetical protein
LFKQEWVLEVLQLVQKAASVSGSSGLMDKVAVEGVLAEAAKRQKPARTSDLRTRYKVRCGKPECVGKIYLTFKVECIAMGNRPIDHIHHLNTNNDSQTLNPKP